MDGLLHYAMLGDVASIQVLLTGLNAGDCVKLLNEQIRDEEDNTPLHIAVIFRRTAVVKLLVCRGASAIALNRDLMMPISYCQDKEMFNALIFRNADKSLIDMINISEVPLPSSDREPRKVNVITRTDCKQRTLLHYAALFCRDAEIFTTLISKCESEAAVELILMQDEDGATFLHLAAQVGNIAALEAVKNLEYAAVIDSETCEKLLCGAMYIRMIDPSPHMQDMEFNTSLITSATSRVSTKRISPVTILMQQEMDQYKKLRYKNTQSPAMDALLHNKKDFFDKLVHMRGDTHSVKVTIKAIMDKLMTDPIITKDLMKKLEESKSLSLSNIPQLYDDVNIMQEALLAVVPVTYVALFAGNNVVFDAMLRSGIININQWDTKFKRTCLHLAVLHNREDIVNKLVCAEINAQSQHWRPSMTIQDVYGKTAAQLAFEQNNQNILELPAFKEHIEELFRDRDVYVQGINAILVGAALITSVTFAGWLQRPSQFFRRTEMQVFWASNSVSFYSAVAAMCVAIGALLPTPTKYVGQMVSQLRLAIVVDAFLLALSLAAVTCSFTAAGFAALRDSTATLPYSFRNLYRTVKFATTTFGSFVCGFALLAFVLQLVMCLPSLPDVVFIFMPRFSLGVVSRLGCLQRILGRVGESSRKGYKQATYEEMMLRISEVNVVPAIFKAPQDEDQSFMATKKNLLKRLLTVRPRQPADVDQRKI